MSEFTETAATTISAASDPSARAPWVSPLVMRLDAGSAEVTAGGAGSDADSKIS